MRRLRRKLDDWRYAPRTAWQRARHGVSRGDAWSLDGYLARVIARGVWQLRYANPETGRPNGWPGDPMLPEEWDRILEQIAGGFEHYAEHENWNAPEVQDAMALFAHWFPHLWD